MGRHGASVLVACVALWSARARAEEGESYFDEPAEGEAEEDGDATAEPDSEPDVPQVLRGLSVYAGVLLGAGGDLDPTGGASDELVPSIGLYGGLDYVVEQLTPYLAVAGELRIVGFSSDFHDDSGDGRSWFFDLTLKPRARYALSDRLEIYGTLPFGPSYVLINDDWSEDAGAGFNLGFGPGGMLMFDPRLGLDAELLYLWHWYSTESSIPGTVDTSYRTAQATFLLSFVAKL
jgi:hypothetical protein